MTLADTGRGECESLDKDIDAAVDHETYKLTENTILTVVYQVTRGAVWLIGDDRFVEAMSQVEVLSATNKRASITSVLEADVIFRTVMQVTRRLSDGFN